jgi:hypothetical protein
MQEALSLFEKGPLALVAGAGFEPATSVPPVHDYGPGRPAQVPAGDADFHRRTTIHPELPAPALPTWSGAS